MARILFIEPFYGGSHRAFADGLRTHSRHDIALLTLPEGEWRRRMRRGAIELAEKSRSLDGTFDALVATDMLDIPLLLALTRPRFDGVPVLYFLHENQFTYPRLKGTKLNSWYGQVNYVSALAADAVAFNSVFHREDFLCALETLSRQPTAWLAEGTVERIAAVSQVLPVGLDLARFDEYRTETQSDPPIILWNHRWEFDKSPAMFIRAIRALDAAGVRFQLALAGEPGPNPYPGMLELEEELGDRVVQFGHVKTFAEYARLLWRAKVAVSTARQEFFGISMIEAIVCDCIPIAPKALNYPAIVEPSAHDRCLFEHEEDLVRKLEAALDAKPPAGLAGHVRRWDWPAVAPQWDAALDALADRRRL